MKVLRTALLSTLLITCFAHISHAQLLGGGLSACDQAVLGVVGSSMEYLGNGEIKLIYDATVANHCGDAVGYTQVICNGVVVYSETVENGTLHVDTVVEIPIRSTASAGNLQVNVECTACEGNNCYREGGAVAYTGG